MIRISIVYVFLLLLARGEFFKVQIGDLTISEDGAELLGGQFREISWRNGASSTVPNARFSDFAFVVPGFAEPVPEGAIAIPLDSDPQGRPTLSEAWLILDLESAVSRKGFLDIWNARAEKWETLSCELEAAELKKCSEEETDSARRWHASHQLRVGSKGGLWYRNFVKSEPNRWRENSFDQTFTTLSGGRALAENLALDRDLILGQGKEDTMVEISTIKGVTVAPIPWKEWMPEGEIEVDELSRRVPEDQYFMVVPSLKTLFGLMDRMEEAGTPLVQSFAVGDDYRDLPSRYRKQMGMDLPDVLAGFLPVKSVAVTGGDPFFPTGSDIAVIMQTDKVDSLYKTLKSTLAAKAKLAGAVTVGDGELVGFQNKERSFSSFLAKLDGAVVVSNSPVQISRLREVAAGAVPALGMTEEYRFFRHRYAVSAEESAYVFISDACLRHWSGPKVRIAASRRNRALAALAKVTSRQLESGVVTQDFQPLLGKVEQVNGRILSEKYGTLGFLTPISELEISKVTTMEESAYIRWRRGYENGWARFFDPIAIRLNLKKDREEMDMTILPLRVDSEYQEFIEVSGNAILSAASEQAPAEALLHLAMAVDHESEVFQQLSVSMIDFLPSLSVNPLGWMGESFSISFGESLAWRSDLREEMLVELPVLIRIDVESRLKLALFLTGIKASIEASGPDLVTWETRQYGEKKYVAMVGDGDELGLDISIYYAALPSGLLISLNEEMLKRAMDREQKLIKGKKGTVQFVAQTNPEFLSVLSQVGGGQSLEQRRRGLSYRALPILNEWYKSRGAKDPVTFHQARFGTLIACPGGEGFQWNESDLTVESVAYGHPGNLRSEARPMEIFARFKTMAMKGSFEKGGMRMAVALDEKSDFVSPVVEGEPRPADDQVISFYDIDRQTPGMVLKFETETVSGFDRAKSTEVSEHKIDRVTKQGDVVVVQQTTLTMGDDNEVPEVLEYEVGPKGLRMLSVKGKKTLVADEDGYEFPAELWPGRIFQVQKEVGWSENGVVVPSFTDATLKVIGWEAIQGPDGKDLEALRIERQMMILTEGRFMRWAASEWYARGLGLVRMERNSGGMQSTMRLIEVEIPE